MESLLRYLDDFFLNVLLSEIARANGGNGISEAVITVPFHFSDEQKTAMREAAEDAGFDVLRVISQPAAAALAYEIGQNDRTIMSACL